MTTFALIGAGPGLGLATARRFGAAYHRVALIARNSQRLDDLTAELTRDGIEARGFAADVLDIESLTAALYAAGASLGPVEILQYSPVPRADFMKPVLDTGADDLDAPLAFSVKGPVTAVNAVLPGMRELGRGTVLFVNGSSAVRPNPNVAGDLHRLRRRERVRPHAPRHARPAEHPCRPADRAGRHPARRRTQQPRRPGPAPVRHAHRA